MTKQKRTARERVEHALESIAAIEQFADGIATTEDLEADRRTKSAIERELLIVSEAVWKMPAHVKSVLIPGDIRDRLHQIGNSVRHEYDEFGPARVLRAVNRDMPKLKPMLEEALRSPLLDTPKPEPPPPPQRAG